MTVKQLINKLKKMPEDATVFVYNNDFYDDGSYKVVSSEIKYFDYDNSVAVGTDYKEIKVEYAANNHMNPSQVIRKWIDENIGR